MSLVNNKPELKPRVHNFKISEITFKERKKKKS